jgi:hypothetical protein
MTKLLASALALVAASLSVAACSTSPQFDIASTPLSGTVGGTPWTFQVGATDAFLSEGSDDFFATFYASSYTPCVDSEPSGPHLIVAVPKAPGDYDMSLARNMTFIGSDDRNLIAIDGRIVIDSVTATTVVGGLHGTYDGSNEVNGRFQLAICPGR